ncbi:MAG: hypothetical protein KJ847_01560, partial [Firmicutes bacterium]|nr:hypothetical protein [Bacillota bacterium]
MKLDFETLPKDLEPIIDYLSHEIDRKKPIGIVFLGPVGEFVFDSIEHKGALEVFARVYQIALDEGRIKNHRGSDIGKLASTDPKNYIKHIERGALGQAFHVINIDEMDKNTAIQVLEMKSSGIENKQGIYFSYDSIEQAVSLSDRYIYERFLPEKAIEIIEETAVFVKNNKKENKVVLAQDVAQIISNRTNILLTSITQEESDKLLHLEEQIHERLIGQDEAVKVVSES